MTPKRGVRTYLAVVAAWSLLTSTTVTVLPAGGPEPVVWQLDNLQRIGGYPVTVIGSPRIVSAGGGKAIEFDGVNDGLVLEVNPLANLEQFTIEVLLEPAADGPAEQRFLHFEEHQTGNRALLETRMLPDRSWCLDTFLRHGDAALTLIDRSATHPASSWHRVALTFDGRTMRHAVDGRHETGGTVQFKPLAAGRTSIGVRLNRVHWFKGRIATIRITPAVLPAEKLMKAPA